MTTTNDTPGIPLPNVTWHPACPPDELWIAPIKTIHMVGTGRTSYEPHIRLRITQDGLQLPPAYSPIAMKADKGPDRGDHAEPAIPRDFEAAKMHAIVREQQPAVAPTPDTRSLRERLRDLPLSVYTRDGIDRLKFHGGNLPVTVLELADALDAAYEPPSGPPSQINYLRTIVRQAISILRGLDAPTRDHPHRHATTSAVIYARSLVADLRNDFKPTPRRLVMADTLASMADWIDALHSDLAAAKDLGQKHADERDADRKERAEATQAALHALRQEMHSHSEAAAGRAVAARCLRIVENAVRGVNLARAARPDEFPVLGMTQPDPTPIVTLTRHDLDPARLRGDHMQPIEPGHSFGLWPAVIQMMACRFNEALRQLAKAKILDDQHTKERDEAREELGLWMTNSDALQKRIDALLSGRLWDGTIGHAGAMLEAGLRVRRRGWNGKGMWLTLVRPRDWNVDQAAGTEKLPWVGMRTADGAFVPWACSQTDLLARDWEKAE